MSKALMFFLVALGFLLNGTAPSYAETKWIDLPVTTGGSVKALFGVPDGITKAPAVIYNHGTFVRRMGYDAARSNGYDVADYVKALNDAGYVALAPVRDEGVMANANGRDVMREDTPSIQAGIEQGIASLKAAVSFLRRHETSTGKVGCVGFSEGGLVTLWSLLRGLETDAAVLMSPATYKNARRLNMRNALSSQGYEDIKTPVMVTLGEDDNKPIPRMKKAGVSVETKPDYMGDHGWFWKVRKEHFSDVRSFLDQHLK